MLTDSIVGINAVFILAFALSAVLAQAPPKLPNIGYIGYGYNVFLGNPHASSHFDPGFGQGIIIFIMIMHMYLNTDIFSERKQ